MKDAHLSIAALGALAFAAPLVCLVALFLDEASPGHLLCKAGLLCRSASRAAALATLPVRNSRRNSVRNR